MLVADAAFDFSSVLAQHAITAPVDVSGTGSNVLKFNLQDLLQDEPSSSTPSYDAYSATTFYGGVAQLLPDPYLYP